MATMTNDLIRWIEERIEADVTLEDEVGLLILAALEGDTQLDDYLLNGTATRDGIEQPAAEAPAGPATGAFLRSVQVTGFRGIGAPVTLSLEPVPGLTIVAGRNGSGKSSIAEGLEMLLTGGTYRWKNKKSTQWSERWRNVHHDGQAEIVAEITEEGSGPVRLCTRWKPEATDVNDHTTVAQRTINGTKGPTQDAAILGWAPSLETYRPMMSYDELGGLLESGPSELYDAIAKVLGMEQLADALARIKSRLTRLSAPQKTATADRKTLHAEAAGLEDERAQAVAPLLKKASPETTLIRELATGVTLPDRGIVASLRALSQLQSPDPATVSVAAARLRVAVSAMAEAGESEATRRVARLDVRRQALRLHAEHGEQSCPVCNQGTLDDTWAQTSRDLVAREEYELRELSDARAGLDAARRALRALVQRRPTPTDRAPTEELEPVVAAARSAWVAFESIPDGDLALADHLELHAAELASAVGEARTSATAALAERDDAWGPLAARISAWCEMWDDWLAKKPAVDGLGAAEKWLKENDTRLKNERIAPISAAAKHAWSLLRQESNVDLGDLRLEGQATRRRVSITATIDGTDAGSALPVMSQGELHALTLALFLPRASLENSPFRFVILDDPVQAMDPAKVDGLVALLSEIAKTRQVVVFSHDDRLPAALRRTDASARIFEVVRGPDSSVSISPVEDPARRYLSDADALCMDDKVPVETLRRTLPGLLRMAIEAAARDRFYAARLTRGDPLTEVETVWNDARGTSQRVSLALYDDIEPLDNWLRTESRRKGMGIATSGFHRSMHSGTDPSDAVYHTRRMIEDLNAGGK
jgi:energy-coupling factor transporter ATP-binding protein EcfA2